MITSYYTRPPTLIQYTDFTLEDNDELWVLAGIAVKVRSHFIVWYEDED